MSALIVRVLLRRPTSQTFRFTPIRTLIVPRRHGVRIRTNHPFARLGARICRGHSAHRHARVRRRFLIHIVCIRFIEGQFLRVLREGKKNKISQISNFRCDDDALLQSSSSSSLTDDRFDSIPFHFLFVVVYVVVVR